MLSYRHSFHAGNHADVLKHITLMLLIEKLKRKDKPAVYIDTHAGAGVYDLSGEQAQKTGEYLSGIGRISHAETQNPVIHNYMDLVDSFLRLNQYPGSPMIANALLRVQDKLHLLELHNSEIQNLRNNLKKKAVAIHHRDAFEGLIGLLPPTPKRGLVLIDPPYERLEEYRLVSEHMNKALRVWPIGIYAIWYPLLSARAGEKSAKSEEMLAELALIAPKSLLDIRLIVDDKDSDTGMYGSGVAIVNPPWQMDEELNQIGQELAKILSSKEYTAQCQLTWLKQEMPG